MLIIPFSLRSYFLHFSNQLFELLVFNPSRQ